MSGAGLELMVERLRWGLWGYWKLRTHFLGLCPRWAAALCKELSGQPAPGEAEGARVAQGGPALGARSHWGPPGSSGPSAEAGMSLPQSAEFLSPKPPHMLLFRLLPSPQFRVSGLIPAQECNYLSSCPHPGEYKEQSWHFGFSLLAVLLGEVWLD